MDQENAWGVRPGGYLGPVRFPDRFEYFRGSGARAHATFPPMEKDSHEASACLSVFPADRFEILDLAGAGGMGRVFRCHDRQLNRTVALKQLHSRDPEDEPRLLLEARFQGAIRHPNVVPVYDVGLLEDRPCITMAFIPGQDLWTLRESLSLREKIALVAQAARGVHAAHCEGMLHRDLKPQNILVERPESGPAKAFVSDFGLARALDRGARTQSGTLAGSPDYFSPEQARGDAILDARSDIFSLGATLYALATGAPPFHPPDPDGSGPLPLASPQVDSSEPRLLGSKGDLVHSGSASRMVETFRRLLYEEPAAPRRLAPEMSRDLETVILCTLQKEPHRRYPSAQALAEDLERVLAGEPVLARRPGPGRRLLAIYRRNRPLAWAMGFSILATLVGAGIAIHAASEAEARARINLQFATQAQLIDDHIRLAHMMPRHDRRTHLAWAQARLATLQEEAAREGAKADGPLAFVTGMVALLSDHLVEAETELERAWRLGFRTPSAAQALSYAAFERSRNENLGLTGSPEARPLSEFAKVLRSGISEPALVLLKKDKDLGGSTPFLEARIAALEGRDPEALAWCRETLAQSPWMYEAHLLRSELLSQGLGRSQTPGKYFGILADMVEELDHAIALAPSDPKPYLAKASALVRLARDWNGLAGPAQGSSKALAPLCKRLHLTATPSPSSLPRVVVRMAMDSCDRAESVDPSCATVYATRARAAYLLLQLRMGENACPSLPETEPMVQDGRRALDLDPSDPLNAHALACALSGQYDAAATLRPGPEASRIGSACIATIRNLVRAYPSDPHIPTVLVEALGRQVQAGMTAGQDPRPSLREMVQIGRPLLQVVSRKDAAAGDYERFRIGLASILTLLGDQEAAFGNFGEARRAAEEGLRVLETGLSSNRLNARIQSALQMWGHLVEAECNVAEGHDPAASFRASAQARAHLDVEPWALSVELLKESPRDEWMLRARMALARSEDPRPWMARARAEARRAIAHGSSRPTPRLCLVRISLEEVRYALAHHLDPAPAARTGLADLAMLARTQPGSALSQVAKPLFLLGTQGRRPRPEAVAHTAAALESLRPGLPGLSHGILEDVALLKRLPPP